MWAWVNDIGDDQVSGFLRCDGLSGGDSEKKQGKGFVIAIKSI